MSAVRTLLDKLEAAEIPATFGNTGGGCFAVIIPMPDGGELLVTDREDIFHEDDLDSDENVFGYYVGRYDADGSPHGEDGWVYATPEDTVDGEPVLPPVGSDVDDVVTAIRNLRDEINNSTEGTWRYTVEVSDCTRAQADQVMAERINHEEEYGFNYLLSFTAKED